MAANTGFRGSFTAIVTPFKNGGVDEAAFRSLVEWQIAEGTHGLVPVGTTGEAAALDSGEQARVIRACVEVASGRVPVIAGCGSNNTAVVLRATSAAADAGADAALVV